MNRTRHLLALALALTGTTPALQAADWPQFRGPAHQGVSEEARVPLQWNATNNVAWKTEIPGEAWSSPVVWKDHVFLTTTTDRGESCRVIAVDRRSGRIRWDREVFRQQPRRKETRNSYATPTPATDGRRVYACFGDGSFVALDFAGKVAWTNRDHRFYSQHGLGTSPLLADGLLVMTRDGSSDGEDKKLGWQKPWDQSHVLALDAATGRLRWKTGRGLSRIAHGAPTLWRHDGRTEVVSEAGDVVQGFDLRSGALLWTQHVAGEGKVPSTLVGEGLVFTSGGWGGKETIKAFRLGGSGDLRESRLVWEQKKGMPRVPSMLYLPPHVFAITDGGVATCLKAATGELVWQERVGGNFSASPVAAAGRIYLVDDRADTTVIAAGPRFEVLARNPLGEATQASPAISQGQVFLRTAHHLWCLGTTEAPRRPAR